MSARGRRAADPPILLVEDKDSLRTMLRLALEAQDHTVVEARDQNEAVAQLQNARPGVVLSDLRLPNGDGFAARSDPAQRSQIERDRQRAVAELDGLTKTIKDDQKALTDFDEEARKASVPPGWLR